MNYKLIGIVALCAGSMAGTAVAQPADLPIFRDGFEINLTAQEDLSAGLPVDGRDVGIVYDSMAFEGDVQTPLSGPGGAIADDYVSTISSPSTLEVFRFVGGVETADHLVFFEFFDAGMNFVDGFGVRFGSASFTTIWTITLNDPTSVDVPAAGFLQLRGDDGTNNPDMMPTNFAWRFKDVQPAIGSSMGDVFRMEMTVIPAPAAAGLFGLGGLAALRRRR